MLKKNNKEFSASLIKHNEKIIDKLEVKNKTEADKILQDLNEADYVVESVEKKETRKAGKAEASNAP